MNRIDPGTAQKSFEAKLAGDEADGCRDVDGWRNCSMDGNRLKCSYQVCVVCPCRKETRIAPGR